MPFYEWIDKKTKKHKTVERDFINYKEKPTAEEATGRQLFDSEDTILSLDEYEAAEWERFIGRGIHLLKGASWNYSKGNP